MNQQALIEQVVAEVMGKLMARNAAPQAVVPQPVRLCETVITADLLAESVGGRAFVEVGPKALVTPSARDWLRQNNVELLRRKTAANQTTTQNVGRRTDRRLPQDSFPSPS